MWGIAPGEFWNMQPSEWWLLYDVKVGGPKYGRLTEEQVDELYRMLP
jgi:hypothetical protein